MKEKLQRNKNLIEKFKISKFITRILKTEEINELRRNEKEEIVKIKNENNGTR